MKRELLIFAKYPEPGRVKTRLVGTVGPLEAARLYRGMIEAVMQKTQPSESEYRSVLCFDPPEREDDFRKWFPTLEMRPQSDGDLGHRMLNAFRESLASGVHSMGIVRGEPSRQSGGMSQRDREGGGAGSPPDSSEHPRRFQGEVRAILIGTDCVEIDRSLLCDAFERLEWADLVLGPATDGGYYLIGLKKTYPFLFEGIPWSTEKVLNETLGKAKENDLRVELLKALSDLDEVTPLSRRFTF